MKQTSIQPGHFACPFRRQLSDSETPLCLVAQASPHDKEAIISWLTDINLPILNTISHAPILGKGQGHPAHALEFLIYSLISNEGGAADQGALASRLSFIAKIASETNNMFGFNEAISLIQHEIADPDMRNQIFEDLHQHAQQSKNVLLEHEVFGHLKPARQVSILAGKISEEALKMSGLSPLFNHQFSQMVDLSVNLPETAYPDARLTIANAAADAYQLEGENREMALNVIWGQLDALRESKPSADSVKIAADNMRSMLREYAPKREPKPAAYSAESRGMAY